MTNNESPAARLIIDMISNQPELDFAIITDAFKPILPGPLFATIALAFDMCPVHDQDLDSCRDDDIPDMIDSNVDMYDVPLTACRHLR
jgi:hypothetical protein